MAERTMLNIHWSRVATMLALTTATACDTLRAPIYNLTPCPIVVQAAIADFPDSDSGSYTLAPGQAWRVLGGLDGVKYHRIDITSARGEEFKFDGAALEALRPSEWTDDRWGFSSDGLHFLRDDPPKDQLDDVATKPCAASQPVSPKPQ